MKSANLSDTPTPHGELSCGFSSSTGAAESLHQLRDSFSRNRSTTIPESSPPYSLPEQVCYPRLLPSALERAREILRLAEDEAERIRCDGEREADEARAEALQRAKKELERWKSLLFSSTLNFLHEAISLVCREVVGEELRHSETALHARITRALTLLPNTEEFVLYLHEREAMSRSLLELLPQSIRRTESDPTLSPERARLEAATFTVALEPNHHLEEILTSLKALLHHETSPT